MQPFCSVILCWSFTCSDMAITSFLNIFEVTPYMIVSEQDSETSLNRRKPRPPADAASIWIDLLIGMFQEHWTVLAHLTREFHPLRFSQVAPFACDGPRPVCQGRFNARTEAGQSYLPNMRVIAPKPATACLCAEGCSPYTSFLKLGSWPAQSRTAFLSGAYRMYPMYLFNFQAVASPHGCIAANAFVPNGECRNVSQIEPHFPQRVKEKGG